MMNFRGFTRRNVLKNSLAGLAGFVGAAAMESLHSCSAVPEETTEQAQTILKHRANAKGLIYGAAAKSNLVKSNPALANLYALECGMVVAEAELKWDTLRPNPKVFDFSQADWLAWFAQQHNMQFRGHPLIWHKALPKWFRQKVNHNEAEKILIEHISTVVKHYAGQMHSWDVVNEAIKTDDRRADNLRKTLWLESLGPEYIQLAFQIAAQADPNALLTYNDYWLEYDVPAMEAKRGAVLDLLAKLMSKGIPIHALGIQSHLSAGESRFNPEKLRNFLRDAASLGLKIMITELDVVDRDLPKDFRARDRLVAQTYENYLAVVLDEPATIAVITWGLSDQHTWIANSFPRNDGYPVRPLPFDSTLNPKPALNAIANSFDRAPNR